MSDKGSFEHRCAVFLLNEIEPRADRIGLPLSEFLPPRLASDMVRREMRGERTRHETRLALGELETYYGLVKVEAA